MEPGVEILGLEVDAQPCTCPTRDSFVLFTTHLDAESPLRCGQCSSPVPLDRVDRPGDFRDVLWWQHRYRLMDQLYIDSIEFEQSALRQMSSLHSSLSKEGLAVCSSLGEATKLPVYYFLFQRARFRPRKPYCPGCGKSWRLDRLRPQFDLRCDECRIVSMLGENTRRWSSSTQ